jgi:hypothetical protein
MEPIRTLFATQPTEPSETALPEGLRARYDRNLSFLVLVFLFGTFPIYGIPKPIDLEQ